jgi:hypothetical protein
MRSQKSTRNSSNTDNTDSALIAGRATLNIPSAVVEHIESQQQERQTTSIRNKVQETRHQLVLAIFFLFVVVSVIELVIVAGRGGAAGASNTIASDGKILRTVLSDILTGAVWQRNSSVDNETPSKPN